MQLTATRQVECYHCDVLTSIDVPDEDVDLETSHSVAAFGEQRKVTCANGHTYWVHFC
ncbi:hypothetical protein SAMN04487967_2656 [Natronorubrum sediminis]|uniref:Uncharacterized protein n=1 Tax=Natronorubrum sediminis TaxID=640943 RepID=A0A1H6G2G2_9EURY|nr:hypothetical protein [Natronorubrum sediminis]SEH16483.1 hypothetical protein SAMN04487967_2656 [Natronorubrum sediminis]